MDDMAATVTMHVADATDAANAAERRGGVQLARWWQWPVNPPARVTEQVLRGRAQRPVEAVGRMETAIGSRRRGAGDVPRVAPNGWAASPGVDRSRPRASTGRVLRESTPSRRSQPEPFRGGVAPVHLIEGFVKLCPMARAPRPARRGSDSARAGFDCALLAHSEPGLPCEQRPLPAKCSGVPPWKVAKTQPWRASRSVGRVSAPAPPVPRPRVVRIASEEIVRRATWSQICCCRMCAVASGA